MQVGRWQGVSRRTAAWHASIGNDNIQRAKVGLRLPNRLLYLRQHGTVTVHIDTSDGSVGFASLQSAFSQTAKTFPISNLCRCCLKLYPKACMRRCGVPRSSCEAALGPWRTGEDLGHACSQEPTSVAQIMICALAELACSLA